MEEHFFQCPYCWQKISMLFDSSVNNQTYIEDCEMCCNPIEINPIFSNSELIALNIKNIEQ
ncbi:CPXCG motif-containing cysteine-rich protein [Lutibacter sp.]|uniref:CPXCG motif-containing cysteine-rich protein n=1 Tax=Lutibacter sp. TaxID=1925666 RepID=UPI0034A03C90